MERRRERKKGVIDRLKKVENLFDLFVKMEEHRSIIKEVFGESSDSEDDDQQIQLDDPNAEFHSQLIFGKSPSWEPVCQINGLSLCRDLLSHDQQSSLLSAIENGACIYIALGRKSVDLFVS